MTKTLNQLLRSIGCGSNSKTDGGIRRLFRRFTTCGNERGVDIAHPDHAHPTDDNDDNNNPPWRPIQSPHAAAPPLAAPYASLRADCPTPMRHMKVGLHEDRWNEAEREHLLECQRCQDVQFKIASTAHGPFRGLIADDNEKMFQPIRIALKELKADLVEATDIETTWHKAEQAKDSERPFDFFLLDEYMPDDPDEQQLASETVATKLRNAGYDEPIFIFTAHEIDDRLRKVCADKDLTPLPKSYLKHELARQIKRELCGRRREDQLTP